MFFQRKGKLRKEYDEALLEQLGRLQRDWLYQKDMLEKSLDPSEDAVISTKMAEVKYFYLFKEAKHRGVSMKRPSK